MNETFPASHPQRTRRQWTIPTPAPRDQGVGGWLLLLCLGLTIFRPLFTLGSIVVTYGESAQYFGKYPGLMIVTFIDTVLSIGLMAFSICAGIGLWRVQSNAVQVTKVFLLCLLGYAVVSSVLPFLAGLPSEANVDMIAPVATSAFKVVIYVAIWYSYLNKSERVRATYGQQPRASYPPGPRSSYPPPPPSMYAPPSFK